MKINLSLRYWLGHKSRGFAVILAVAVAMAALTCTAFLVRGASETHLEGVLGGCSFEDFTLIDVDSEILDKYQNDNRVDDWGILYRDGKIITSDDTEFVFGAMTEKCAPIYRFPFEVGNYPEKSGEIAVPRTMLEALGYPVGVGMTISVDLYDFDDNLIGTGNYTVSGVLKDQSEYYFDPIKRGYYKPGFSLERHYGPIVFLHPSDLSQNAKTDLLIVSEKSEKYYSLKKEFSENKMDYVEGGGRISKMWDITNQRTGDTEEEMLESLKHARPDEYTRTLIPVFTAVTMIVAFVSIFSVISTSLSERRRQLSMLRCIGMSKKKAILMLLSETLVLVAIGLAVGFAFGIGAYFLTYFIQKNVLGMETYLAFSVHPAVAAVTANPYILPLLSCFICGFLAIIIPAIIELRRSPAEGLQDKPQKKGDSLFQFKNKSLLLGKISGGLLQNLPYYIIVIAVVWTGVFGCTYFAAKTDANTSQNRKKLETELHGLDYLAHRKEFYALGNAQLNRHFLGIAPEYAEKVMDHSEVEKAFKVIEIPSTKVIFERGSLDEETEKILAPSNTAISIFPGLDELFYKTLEFQGYRADEVMYNIPTVAVSNDIMAELSKYLVEGEISVDKLRSGEEILVVRSSDTALFSVGDSVSMNDVIIEDRAAEEYDFEKGGVPEGAEPSFYFKYTDEEAPVLQPGYAFGKRLDFTVKIGGVLEFTDDSLSDFLKTGSVIGRSSFQFICDEEAISAWGLPDRNYTKIGVILNKKANVEEFEKTWFEVVRNSPDIGSNSVSKIRHKLNNTRNSNSSIFMAIMITVVILGLVGIVNSANLRVRKGLHSFSTARALGLTRNGLTAVIMRQGIICALLGAVTSVIPLGVYEMVRRSAEEFRINGGITMLTPENSVYEYTWQDNFPTHIELWKQPIFLIILAVLAAVCAVILISNMIPARWIAKKNITEALRNDDF